MEVLYRAIDGKEFEELNECMSYELTTLGVMWFDANMETTSDYESCHVIFIPRAEDMQIVVDYADLDGIDAHLWKFEPLPPFTKKDDPLLFRWDANDNIFKYESYSELLSLMTKIKNLQNDK